MIPRLTWAEVGVDCDYISSHHLMTLSLINGVLVIAWYTSRY